MLRRDGFASMDAGDEDGTLTTRPVTFRGKHLFVNVAAEGGELRAEVLDEDGQVIAGADARQLRAGARGQHAGRGDVEGADLARLAGKAVRSAST